MTEKKVLECHKKVKSRFIPPMMQLPNIQEIGYINQILPEIIWMGLINDELGYHAGIALSSNLAKIAYDLKETDKHINFTLVSNFNSLSTERKSDLIRELKETSELERYRYSLLPLIALYEEFPLSFIGMSEKMLDKPALIKKIKKCIEKHIDKYETPALVIQANVLYVRGSTGGLHVAPQIEIPDLNTLIEDPESEKAKRAGAFVRISAMQELIPLGEMQIGGWAKSFWNQGYKIDKCDFSLRTK